MSKGSVSFSLPQVLMRKAAQSADAGFDDADSPVWNIPVYHLDKFPSVDAYWKVKASVRCPVENCGHRDEPKTPYVPKNLKTADALCLTPHGGIYFIEFKAQPSKNVEKEDLQGKAFESLYAAALSALGDCPMAHIRANAEFVVVFKRLSDSTKTFYTQQSEADFRKISNPIRGRRGLRDRTGSTIYFDLDRFRKAGYYRDVHTFDETQFLEWATKTLFPPSSQGTPAYAPTPP